MKRSSILKLFVFTGLLFAAFSCTKNNEDNEPRLALPNAGNFRNLRAKALKNLEQIKTFKAEEGIVFTSVKGTRLQISGGCLQDQSGNPVTGDVTLSFVEIYDRADMALTNKPTMGRDANGNKLPMVTGGEFNIEVKQADKILKSGCPFSLNVPASNTGGLDNEMVLWNGAIDDNGNLVWNEADPKGRDRANPDEKTASYNVLAGSFGWTNVDRFYSDPRPKTQIKVAVPEGYDNSNAGVYLAYEDQPGMLAQLDTYNSAEKYFSEHYGFVPVGLNVHVIFISESDGDVALAIKPVTITSNATVTIASSDILKTKHDTAKNAVSNIR